MLELPISLVSQTSQAFHIAIKLCIIYHFSEALVKGHDAQSITDVDKLVDKSQNHVVL